MTRRFLLGSYVDVLTMQETLMKVEAIIRVGKPVQHVVINASKINLMAENKELANIVNASPLINADGQSIIWAMKILAHETQERVTGIDLFEKLVKKKCGERLSCILFWRKGGCCTRSGSASSAAVSKFKNRGLSTWLF
ncbi:WecB/TagA/CpsF family glycosyltransferase [Listeria rocourtiae]|uniref:WecB/TagA/CpsF family glycosyltransferase n=1 Tax=Listeria rocourtiae TaxID=647910 RepID=UPI00313460EE